MDNFAGALQIVREERPFDGSQEGSIDKRSSDNERRKVISSLFLLSGVSELSGTG